MRHFRLSLFAHAVSLMAVAAIALAAVCLELHKSVLQETVYAMLAVWSVFTIYFFALLYCGIRFDRGLVEGWRREYYSMQDAQSLGNSLAESPDLFTCGSDLEGCVAGFLGYIAVLIIVFCAPVLIWLGVNSGVLLFLALFFAIYWVFRRGMRLVMVNVKRCRGNYLKSLGVSALHSLGYALLLGGVVYASEYSFRFLRHSGGL